MSTKVLFSILVGLTAGLSAPALFSQVSALERGIVVELANAEQARISLLAAEKEVQAAVVAVVDADEEIRLAVAKKLQAVRIEEAARAKVAIAEIQEARAVARARVFADVLEGPDPLPSARIEAVSRAVDRVGAVKVAGETFMACREGLIASKMPYSDTSRYGCIIC